MEEGAQMIRDLCECSYFPTGSHFPTGSYFPTDSSFSMGSRFFLYGRPRRGGVLNEADKCGA